MNSEGVKLLRKPDWLKIKLPKGQSYKQVKNIVEQNCLHTICQSGNCPNMGECWGSGTATFMILGDICTRSCKFCAVKTGRPEPVDSLEPVNVAKSVKLMGLRHCVLTSVDRDDLGDGGAHHWKATISEIKKETPGVTIEALIPDFKGNHQLLDLIVQSHPEVVSHNLETVRSLTGKVRSVATYDRSLLVLDYLGKKGMLTKSGIMVGVGETDEEIYQTMDDLVSVGCRIFTIGQYLQPSLTHLPVNRYVHPDQFEEYRKEGIRKGFDVVESAPLVRSSYHAEKHLFVKLS